MKSNSFVKISFLIIGLLACGFLGVIAYKRIQSISHSNQLAATAETLGYSPEEYLVQYEACSGIITAHCQLSLYFTTSQHQTELQSKIDSLLSMRKNPQSLDGYALLNINLETDHVLAINGVSDPVKHSQVPPPAAVEWLFTNGGKNWAVVFYNTATDENVYEFDNRQLSGNIVAVIIQTK